MSFHPDTVRLPAESLRRLFEGNFSAWSAMARVDRVLEAADLSLLDSRMFRGTRQFFVLTPENVVDRFQGFHGLEAYALGLVRAQERLKRRQ